MNDVTFCVNESYEKTKTQQGISLYLNTSEYF